jgi:hypothetical protein
MERGDGGGMRNERRNGKEKGKGGGIGRRGEK